MIINGYFVDKIYSFKEYMESFGYSVLNTDGTSKYQSGYFLSNDEWRHISLLGKPDEIELLHRDYKIDQIL